MYMCNVGGGWRRGPQDGGVRGVHGRRHAAAERLPAVPEMEEIRGLEDREEARRTTHLRGNPEDEVE